jgi:predicted ATPase/DNA-binding SARP family transcriptional activator
MQASDNAAPTRVTLLGPPILHAAQTVPFAPERRFQLLAVLAYHAGEWVERDHLAALFWADRENSEARRNLRKVLFKAHELVGGGALDARDHAIRWTVATDLQNLRTAVAEQRGREALALLSRPLLAGIDDPDNEAFAEWLATERSRLAALRHDLALEHLPALDGNTALTLAQRMLEDDPLDEVAVATLMRVELARGQATLAQRMYLDFAARLAEELGVEPSQGLRRLLEARPETPAAPARTELPAAAGTFIGRRAELAEATALLARAECRLLNVIGPGGVGKSRLAREIIEQQHDRIADRHWVQMQDVADPVAAVARIAQSLAIEINDTGDTLEQLRGRLPGRRVLLVLDNVEHLPLREMLERLVGAASLTIIVTSRARLHCAGEWLLPLDGLAVPDEESRDLDAASAFDSVRLFDVRARAADQHFELAKHLPAVVQIVESVDGLPLAIELAASWVRLLPPEEIARDLRGSIDVLERDPASNTLPLRPEHVSLRAALSRSWNLLGPFERQALADISVFHGGFARASARAVTQTALPVLASLADKSLLATDPVGRFALHPMVALFAAEMLAERPDRAAELAMRHAEHYARRVEDLTAYLRTGQRRMADAVTLEFANILQAWRVAVAQARSDLVCAMVRVLQSYFEQRGRLAEGIHVLTPALQIGGPDAASMRARVRTQQALSLLLFRAGDLDQAQLIAEAALEPAAVCGERGALIGCLLNIGNCLSSQGQVREALGHFERALAIAREEGDRHAAAVALGNLGIAEKRLGNHDRAFEHYCSALAAERELGNQYAVAIHLNNLGALSRNRDPRTALNYLREGAAHCLANDIRQMMQFFQLNLGLTELDLGNVDAAADHLFEALDRSRAAGQLQIELSAELALSEVDLRRQHLESARQRLRRVAYAARAKSYTALLADTAYFAGELEAMRGSTERAAAIFILCAAHPATEAVNRQRAARRLLACGLTPDQQRAASVRAPTLESVIDELLATDPLKAADPAR